MCICTIYKDEPDELFEKLNNNHPKINYTADIKPEKFLDAKIIYEDDKIPT